MLKLLQDIDGCLANWDTGFAKVLNELTDHAHAIPTHDFEPLVWDWPTEQFDVSSSDVAKAWDKVKADHSFWESLSPYPHTWKTLKLLNALANDGHEIYFVTARTGVCVKNQTERWLYHHGMTMPTVIPTEASKLDLARALKIDIVIEDNPAIAQAWKDERPNISLGFVKREYNRAHWNDTTLNAYENAYDAVNMETWKRYHTGKYTNLEVA